MQLKVYRRDNRKRDARRWRKRLLRAAAILAAAICAAALYLTREPLRVAAASMRDFVIENPYFAVREIQVRGGSKISGNEIVAVAGLKQGMNIWRMKPAAIEARIARHPWVKRVLVRRDFPRRIVIEVEERVPKAIVALHKLYYVDAEGVLFKEVGAGESVQFPLLTGLRADDLVSSSPATRRRIKEALQLGSLMEQRSHRLSEIHFDGQDRISVYTTRVPVALRLGWGDWEEKLDRLERLLSLWRGHEERLASLDLSYRDQVVARLRHAGRD